MARKTRNHRFDLPPLELRCMKALWALGEGSVQEIRSRLVSERPLAYTTVMTIMDRLARKGAVEREKHGRAHFYRPRFAEDPVRERALDRLVENFFRGSRADLREHLSGSRTDATKPRPPARPSARPRETQPAPTRRPAPEGRAGASIDPSLL